MMAEVWVRGTEYLMLLIGLSLSLCMWAILVGSSSFVGTKMLDLTCLNGCLEVKSEGMHHVNDGTPSKM